ncbi:hypothetical protein SAMN04489761_0851 [Tenacibaculum sp. MAR_2009_124]|uniref:hypothetical protein n=1 Tax=Tenacibaculum sp. MAR_2009_124 TaxID=1250059 RepID=UPI00089471D1|nr:hypothetical protein [Tenacibaculum sp. MAR_2009_124]SEB46075.1 hypothetical protein SAMN04489761_0851 [Tenacibaculum sp. MAR_2009_124]
MEEKKKNKVSNLVGGLFALSIILGSIGYELRKDYLINNYRKQAIGIIISYDDSTSKHGLRYKYKVNGRLYFEIVGVEHFSEFEKNNCIGKQVIVNYSSKEPSYSHVHLGEYQSKKKTVHLMNSFN